MDRQDLKNIIYSRIKDLSDFEKSKIDNYKAIKLDFGGAVCDFVKKQFQYDSGKMQKYENAIMLMLYVCDYITRTPDEDITLYTWIDAWIDVTDDIDDLKIESVCSLMFKPTPITGDKIIVSLLRDYRIAVIFAKIDHSPLGFKSKIMRALCPQYITYYYKNYILIDNDTVETARLKETLTLKDRLLSMNELTYSKFVYLWGKIYKYITNKDFDDEYKAYANNIDAKP